MITQSKKINEWVDEMATHFSPQKIHWCNGSQQEYDLLCRQLVDKGTFIKLHETKRPDSFACFTGTFLVFRIFFNYFFSFYYFCLVGVFFWWPKGKKKIIKDYFFLIFM